MTDAPQILLAHHLKALKLPTFLREYDKVARLCAAEGVDHPRYLMRLAEMEMIDRERRMVDRRIKAARFPTVKSLDSFDFLALPGSSSLSGELIVKVAPSVQRKGHAKENQTVCWSRNRSRRDHFTGRPLGPFGACRWRAVVPGLWRCFNVSA